MATGGGHSQLGILSRNLELNVTALVAKVIRRTG